MGFKGGVGMRARARVRRRSARRGTHSTLLKLVDLIATFFLEAVGVWDAAILGDSRFHVRVLALRSDFEE